MELYLIRHGAAEAGATDDASRKLTARGESNTQSAANWLAKKVKGPVSLWASPYVRTQQTAEPIAKALGIEVAVKKCLQPEVTAQKLIDELNKEQQSIILVTHLPLIGRLASLLTEGVVLDQPWSPTEIWQLQGDVFATGCLTTADVWYPALEEG